MVALPLCHQANTILGQHHVPIYGQPLEVIFFQRQTRQAANTLGLGRSLDGLGHQDINAAVHDLVLASIAHGARHFQHVQHDAVHDGEAVEHGGIHQPIIPLGRDVMHHDASVHVQVAAVMGGAVGIGAIACLGGGDAVQFLGLAGGKHIGQLGIVQRQQLGSLDERANIIQRHGVQDVALALQQLGITEAGGDGGIVDGRHHTATGGLVAIDTGEATLAGLLQHGEGVALLTGGPDGLAVDGDEGAGLDGHGGSSLAGV